MNTPKTPKPPVRHDPLRYVAEKIHEGEFILGIEDPETAQAMGSLIGFWTMVEEAMVGVLEVLMDDHSTTPRHIFRTISNQHSRILVMQKLLHDSPKCASLGSVVDDAIDEFAALNGIRNSYMHGLWSTESSTGRAYLAIAQAESWAFAENRGVTAAEIETVFKRMEALYALAFRIKTDQLRVGPSKPSKQTAPPRPPQNRPSSQ